MIRCIECQEVLSDYIDGLLELGERVQVERHLADCTQCRDTRDDILQIVHFSKNLPSLEPSSAVWSRISAELEPEMNPGVRRTLRGLRVRIQTGIDRLGAQRFAMAAAAAAVALSAGIVVLESRSGTAPSSPTATSAAVADSSAGSAARKVQIGNDSAVNINEIEQYIDQLRADVERRRSGWDPEVQRVYERDMLSVDQSLARCRHDLSDNPGDDLTREMMLDAYKQKVRLLEGFGDF